ncbi:MAG: hypothetical protein P4L31_01775, partial [Candidatus Babeliales bacterium]|nr:hypothetical protein [Candidatus Babeliales bacterium]
MKYRIIAIVFLCVKYMGVLNGSLEKGHTMPPVWQTGCEQRKPQVCQVRVWQAETFDLGNQVEVLEGIHKGKRGEVVAYCQFAGDCVQNCMNYALEYAKEKSFWVSKEQYDECEKAMVALYKTNPWVAIGRYDPVTRSAIYPRQNTMIIAKKKSELLISYWRSNMVVFLESPEVEGMFHDTALKNLENAET